MKQYEIYWDDLSDEAKKKFKGIYHANINLTPLVILENKENSSTIGSIIFDSQVAYEFVSDKVLTNEELAQLKEEIKINEREPRPGLFAALQQDRFGIKSINRVVQSVTLNEEHIEYE